ncbi:putative secreted protein [Mycolicibacterium aurum]|uniref:Putative secreted protein n=1 Tax=Mycolicibacterium aurum TaxID=1791 RepID=A0A3S5EJC7_MYCAU|nr:hypothetical protein [Mycolicibacterium aurum]VEG54323.1 putative secreted protein [Mycolicibacterium aurum]
MVDTPARGRRGAMQIPRSRGAVSGLLIVALGAWGALAPFIGPLFDFAFSPDEPWAWTSGRGWLQVLPGVVAVVGGLLMFASRNRATAMLGSWLAVAAGAWFVVGRAAAGPLGLGDAGEPVAANEAQRVWLELTYFSGLGALIIFLAALAVGRLSVRTARDIAYRDARADAVEPVTAPYQHTGAPGTGPLATGPVPVQPDAVTGPEERRSGLFGRRKRRLRDKMPT